MKAHPEIESNLTYAVFSTEAGWIGALGSPQGLVRLTFPRSSVMAALQQLGDQVFHAEESVNRFEDLRYSLQTYFCGCKTDFIEKLDLSAATDFQRSVWEITRQIPYGETRSYIWVAQQMNKPEAARAVGNALGRNPVPVIIPCHRVLTSDGKLGGFGGGLEMKRYLLGLEGAA